MIGTTISHYRITEELGSGGMGVVYRAVDQRLHRSVAIKFLPTEYCRDDIARARFEREAQTASALNHPNICTVYDIGEHEGQPYIVMELLTGRTLKRLAAGGPLTVERIVSLGLEIVDALSAAHQTGIIHRDIKTSNIFVDARDRVRLLDFGLAKLVGDAALGEPADTDSNSSSAVTDARTTTGTLLGTVNYMSPEQARGEHIDARSDLYSLGVVLYELATGRLPFRGKTHAITFDAILNRTAVPITRINPKLPRDLELVIERALSKNCSDRFQTADDFATALQQVKRVLESSAADGETVITIPPMATGSVAVEESSVNLSSIAVLPFVNLGGSAEYDYIGDGLAEELITALMRVPGLQVAARTSTFQFRDQAIDLREVGKRLSVGSVLEGSFRIAGNRIRISANFINVADGYQIWSDRFDRDMDDIFTVQDEIAKTIVHALEISLGSLSQSRSTPRPARNVEAYNHYLRGRFLWKKRSPESIRKAVESFKQALEVDPDYAKAHAGLADCYAMLGIYAVLPRQVVMPQARRAAERALALDDTLAEAWAALGVVTAIHDFHWAAAEDQFRKSITLAPDDATARYWFALFALLPNARFDEAIGQAEWAAQLDPVNPAIAAAVGVIHHMQGHYDQAIETIETALELEADHQMCNLVLAWASVASGRHREAFAALDRCAGMRVAATGARGWAYAVSGQAEEARRLIEELQRMSSQGNAQADFEMARVQVALGEYAPAIESLERTYENRGGTLFWLKVNPLFEPLHGDPRFQGLLEKMGLSQTTD